MSGGVVQAQPFGCMFFYQEVTTVALNDGGDCDAWLPTFIHLAIIFRVFPPRARA
jgi:hypothetical protein